MDTRTQLMVLGLIHAGRYSYDKRKDELINTITKKPQKVLCVANRYLYRLGLGFNERVDLRAAEVHYLLYYGVYDGTGTIHYKDGDPSNVKANNLYLELKGNRIPNDVKQKVYDLWAKGRWYAEIGRQVNLNRLTVKNIIQAKFGEVLPRQSQQNRKFYESMQKDIARSSINITKI